MENLDGAMYIPGPSALVAEVIRDKGKMVKENPLNALLPETTRSVYTIPLVKMLREELGVSARASVLSLEFQAVVNQIEKHWRVSPQVKQQLERHLRLQIYQRWPTREERIAVIHAFLYRVFLDNNGVSLIL